MNNIKLGILGVCLGLFGITVATNNFIAISTASIGLVLSIVGYFRKDS